MQEEQGVTPNRAGLPPASRAEPVSPVSGETGIPNAEGADASLGQVPPESLGAFIAALGDTIALYQKGLNKSLEERHRAVDENWQRERAFLADIMAEYVRLTSFVARGAAVALERSAQGIEGASARETPAPVTQPKLAAAPGNRRDGSYKPDADAERERDSDIRPKDGDAKLGSTCE